MYGGGASGPDTPLTMNPESFRSLRGRLPFPLAGRAEIHTPFVDQGLPDRGSRCQRPPGHPGACGGTRASGIRGSLRLLFGQLVILDHGDRYYTVMGDLAEINISVGDDVSTGAKIGVVGASTSGDEAPAEQSKTSRTRALFRGAPPGPRPSIRAPGSGSEGRTDAPHFWHLRFHLFGIGFPYG